jgi:GNAT superfamily N-acetyltransferase
MAGLEDLKAAHGLSLAERWPHRLQDWQAAAELGEGVVLRRDGGVVGTGMRWLWGDHHATVGLVIVRKDWQRKGLGRQLMEHLLQPLGPRSVLLHATESGQTLYQRLGFEAVGEILRHQGVVQAVPAPRLPAGTQLAMARPGDLDALVALDARGAGMPRRAAIEQLLKQGETVVLRQDDRPVGFAVRRPFGRGLVVGPVVAHSLEGAQALAAHWLHASSQQFVRMDISAASGLADWLAACNLRDVERAVVMVRGPLPQREPGVVSVALISQSLG